MNPWNELYRKLIAPLIIVFCIAFCYKLQINYNLDPSGFGLHPLDINQWWGILTAPLVHGDATHLLSNLMAMAGLLALLFTVYDNVAYSVTAGLWILTGIFMFFFARPQFFHIGASGVVYGLIFFLLISGILIPRRSPRVITLLVAIYYGGTFWGLLPYDGKVSWDGHISGAVAGIVLAFVFKTRAQKGHPAERKPAWFSENDAKTDEYQQFGDGKN